jgi:hypothetical protein
MPTYDYAECLNRSLRINWRIDEVLEGRSFDKSLAWMPAPLSGAPAIGCLSDEEKRKLTHLEMGAYAHTFGYVEEFIAPKISELSQ